MTISLLWVDNEQKIMLTNLNNKGKIVDETSPLQGVDRIIWSDLYEQDLKPDSQIWVQLGYSGQIWLNAGQSMWRLYFQKQVPIVQKIKHAMTHETVTGFEFLIKTYLYV